MLAYQLHRHLLSRKRQLEYATSLISQILQGLPNNTKDKSKRL